jgi:hypothetical protein
MPNFLTVIHTAADHLDYKLPQLLVIGTFNHLQTFITGLKQAVQYVPALLNAVLIKYVV